MKLSLMNDYIYYIWLMYTIVSIIPTISVTVISLHDVGRSGWWMLISLIPYIGGITLFVFTLLDSDEGVNHYGPNSKDSSKTY